MVRYDTPEIFGFVGTVDFGKDDTWEMGLRYKEDKFHGFKVAAAIAYGENTQGPLDAFNADGRLVSSAWVTIELEQAVGGPGP